MNLESLFKAQKELRERINYNGDDRFDKIVLALLVEIGECANEQRSWKFWSTKQEPRTSAFKTDYAKEGHGPQLVWTNPLREESVDVLHFILEMGIELNVKSVDINYGNRPKETITAQFLDIQGRVYDIWDSGSLQTRQFYWNGLFLAYVDLVKMLGFTWDEIETAYFAKNQINHSRQENGY